MRFAFYKAKGSLFDAAIRIWEVGPYSHCEAILAGPDYDGKFTIASSVPGVGVRITKAYMWAADWDFIDVPLTQKQEAYVAAWFRDHSGAKYDYVGIFGFIFRPVKDEKGKYFCSEALGHALQIKQPWRLDPNGLYALLQFVVTQKRI
jgi:hypothetical protein